MGFEVVEEWSIVVAPSSSIRFTCWRVGEAADDRVLATALKSVPGIVEVFLLRLGNILV